MRGGMIPHAPGIMLGQGKGIRTSRRLMRLKLLPPGNGQAGDTDGRETPGQGVRGRATPGPLEGGVAGPAMVGLKVAGRREKERATGPPQAVKARVRVTFRLPDGPGEGLARVSGIVMKPLDGFSRKGTHLERRLVPRGAPTWVSKIRPQQRQRSRPWMRTTPGMSRPRSPRYPGRIWDTPRLRRMTQWGTLLMAQSPLGRV